MQSVQEIMSGNVCFVIMFMCGSKGNLSFLPLSLAVDEDKAKVGDDSVDKADGKKNTVW